MCQNGVGIVLITDLEKIKSISGKKEKTLLKKTLTNDIINEIKNNIQYISMYSNEYLFENDAKKYNFDIIPIFHKGSRVVGSLILIYLTKERLKEKELGIIAGLLNSLTR